MSDTGNQEYSKYLIFLKRDEKTKSYNVINILTCREIIDMRDYDLKDDIQKENIRKKMNVYATNYKNKNDNESKKKNKILDYMVNPEVQNNVKPFLISFGIKDIVLLDIVDDFDESRNITLIPIEIDKGNYIMPRMYNIPNQIYEKNFVKSRSEKNLITKFQSNLIKNVNFDSDNFNKINENIKSKTISSSNIEQINFLDDSEYKFCGFSLEKVDNMIRITSDCFENVRPKTPINNKLFPEEARLERKNTPPASIAKKPNSPAAKSDPGTTSNISSYATNKTRNVRTAPPSEGNKNNKTQKNPKTPFR
jgi:hypothetical protein